MGIFAPAVVLEHWLPDLTVGPVTERKCPFPSPWSPQTLQLSCQTAHWQNITLSPNVHL
jgi:hypothetical protein